MLTEVIVPAQDVYTVSDMVKCLGYTRQSVAKAIREVCPHAEKGSKGYRLTLGEAQSIAAYFSISLIAEDAESAEDGTEHDGDACLVELLKEQIKVKDRQIAALSEQLSAMTEQNLKLIETMNGITDTSKALAANTAMDTAKDLAIAQAHPRTTFWDKVRGLFS